MNKHLKLAALFVGSALLLAACGSSGGNPGNGNGGGGGGGITPPASNFGNTYSRNVTVLNWTSGAEQFTDGPLSVNLDANGKGTITLANETAPTQKYTLANSLASSLGCSPSALTATGDTSTYDGSFDFYSQNSDKTYVYVVDLATADTTFDASTGSTNHSAGGKDGDFYFVTQDFTLKGSASCSSGDIQASYDVTLTPGWNLVTFTDVDGTHWIAKNDVEAGMDWRSLPLENNTASTSMTVKSQSVRSTVRPHASSH